MSSEGTKQSKISSHKKHVGGGELKKFAQNIHGGEHWAASVNLFSYLLKVLIISIFVQIAYFISGPFLFVVCKLASSIRFDQLAVFVFLCTWCPLLGFWSWS